LLLGDDLFLPTQRGLSKTGDYVYAELTKSLKSQTRFTLGIYNVTANVVASGDKAGGQFGIEQPTSRRITLAADWFTGHHSLGYFTPGGVIKLSSKATAYAGYEIGNSGAASGNRLVLLQLGWNLN
jgi:hypothetical protein